MKKSIWAFIIVCGLSLPACERHYVIDGPPAACDIAFTPEQFDVRVTSKTDVIPFEYSRMLPNPNGDIQSDDRVLTESPESEAKMGVHYTVETLIGGKNFLVSFEPDHATGRYEGLHILPSAIDRNMKLVVKNPINTQASVTINLIVE